MENRSKLLLLVLCTSILIRILPNINYPYLLNDDIWRDYSNVLFIIENGNTNLGNDYGAFPILHVFVSVSSILSGISPFLLIKFLPQITNGFFIIFFYFLLRDLTENELHSLVAALLLSVSFAVLYWASLGVRETLGFPLLIFNLYIISKISKTKSWKNYLFISLGILSLTLCHHWSSLMFAMILIAFYTSFSKRIRLSYFILSECLIVISLLVWWRVFFTKGFTSIFYFLAENEAFFFIGIFSIISILILKSQFQKISMIFKRFFLWIDYKFLLLFLLPTLFLSEIYVSVFNYPMIIYINPILIFLIAVLGINGLKNNTDMFSFVFISLILLTSVFLITGLFGIYDANRFIEYISIFLCIPGAMVLIRIRSTFAVPMLMAIILSSVLIFPSNFITNDLMRDTIFYDIRNDLRDTSTSDVFSLDWSRSFGLNAIPVSPILQAIKSLETYSFILEVDNVDCIILRDNDNDILDSGNINNLGFGLGSAFGPYLYEKIEDYTSGDLLYTSDETFIFCK